MLVSSRLVFNMEPDLKVQVANFWFKCKNPYIFPYKNKAPAYAHSQCETELQRQRDAFNYIISYWSINKKGLPMHEVKKTP